MSNSPRAKRRCIDDGATEYTQRMKIAKIANFNIGGNRRSSPKYIGGFPWTVYFERQMVDGSGDSFGVFVGFDDDYVNSNIWFCDSFISVTLVNRLDSAKSYKKSCNKRFDQADFKPFGYPDFASWNDIIDPSTGFIKDGGVLVEVTIRVNSIPRLRFRSKDLHDFSWPDKAADVVLVVEGNDFHVSRKILAIQSSYFNSLFYQHYKERDQEKIPLYDITAKDFEAFLRVVYRINLIRDDEKLDEILRLADMFDMQSILDETENWLLTETKIPLARQLLIADQHNFEVLMDKCLKQLKEREDMMKIKRSSEYNLYSAEFKVQLLEMLLD